MPPVLRNTPFWSRAQDTAVASSVNGFRTYADWQLDFFTRHYAGGIPKTRKGAENAELRPM